MPLSILTVVGARPQFIKAAPVSRALAAKATEFVVNTGQHYDDAMATRFFAELGMETPDLDLGVGSGSHAAQTAAMLIGLEDAMNEVGPDAVLVYGDTNSTLAGALAAAKLNIPVIHVEAGLRSFRRTMPEEVNRVMADHVSEVLLCPTATAVDNLAAEGIRNGVFLVGDVMVDAVHNVLPSVDAGRLERFGLPSRYFAATAHRPVNVDDAGTLRELLGLFAAMPLPVAIAVHPRTQAAMDRHGLDWPETTIALPPLGYLDMLSLVRSSQGLLTDSGGLQKESLLVGTRCIVLRDETEWVETVDAGLATLVGRSTDKALAAVDSLPAPDPGAVEAIFPPGAAVACVDAILEHLT